MDLKSEGGKLEKAIDFCFVKGTSVGGRGSDRDKRDWLRTYGFLLQVSCQLVKTLEVVELEQRVRDLEEKAGKKP